jgi:hypothetical protein
MSQRCCSDKSNLVCAECQEPLPQKKIRSIAVEQIIENSNFAFSCAHTDNGCKIAAGGKALEEHEKSCPYIPGGHYVRPNVPGGHYVPGHLVPGLYIPGCYVPGYYIPSRLVPGHSVPGYSVPGYSVPGPSVPR